MNVNFQRKHVLFLIILVLTGVLVWQLSSSFASVDQGYSGNNIISGDKWGINITKIDNIEKTGSAELVGDVSTIGTTLNFKAVLFKPKDKIGFNVEVTNTSVLDAELYALTLTGLNDIDSENVTYAIMPIDGSIIHDNKNSGSIIRSGEKQRFNITLVYDDVINSNNEYHLSLGSTIIYKQK